MKKYYWLGIALIVIILAVIGYIWYNNSKGEKVLSEQSSSNMKLRSPAFYDNGTIPTQYTCDGSNINPALEFVDVPESAKSLVLIMDDPDVPKDLRPSGVFDHWVVFNIPPETTGVGANQTLNAVYGANGTGEAKYTGPCPPDKEHRYIFQLFALDTTLNLSQAATKDEVLKAMEGHIISQAKLTGRFNREANIRGKG